MLTGCCWFGFGLANTYAGHSVGLLQLTASALALLLISLQSKIPYFVVANTALLSSFVVLALNALMTGGSQSPSIWMFTLGPHYGSFTQGRKGAISYFFISLLFLWGVLLVHSIHPLPQSFEPSQTRRAAVQSLLLALVYYLAWSQRSTLERQIALLQSHEVELRKARDIAEQASSARSRFLATMSHEIRTPLNGIVGLPELLREAESPKAREDLIELLQSSGNHLLGIVNDILDFSKLESATPTIRLQTFDLEELIESVLQSSTCLPGAASLELVASFDCSGPYSILGDPRRLEQILRNLVSNAIKFTSQGRVLVRCYLDEPKARIAVVDTGIGISPQDCQRVFEPFEQVNDDIQREFGGTGLGLAISLKIAKTMGGSLAVESQQGKGSIFTLVFPAPRIQPRSHPSAQDSTLSEHCALGPEVAKERKLWAIDFPPDSYERLKGLAAGMGWEVSSSEGERRVFYGGGENKLESMRLPVTRKNFRRWLDENRPSVDTVQPSVLNRGHRVLVVDDNQVNRVVTKKLLHNLGCEVEVATNGEEALEALKDGQPFSLVLMDIHMPVMDGIRATQEIRSLGLTVPIIALTADVFPEAKSNAMQAGANGIQHKPIRAADLSVLLTAYPPN